MHIFSKPNPKSIPLKIQKNLSQSDEFSLIKQSYGEQHRSGHILHRYNNRQEFSQPYMQSQGRMPAQKHKKQINYSNKHTQSLVEHDKSPKDIRELSMGKKKNSQHSQSIHKLQNQNKDIEINNQDNHELITKRHQMRMNMKSSLAKDNIKKQQSQELIHHRHKNRSLHGYSASQHTAISGLLTIECNFPPDHLTKSLILTSIFKTLTFPSALPSISLSGHPSSKLTSEELINSLSKSQVLHALSYGSQKFKQISEYVQNIFNKAIEIGEKDILIAYGEVMQCYYIFFNSGIVKIGCLQCGKDKKNGIVYAVWREEVKVEDRYRIKKGKSIHDDNQTNQHISKNMVIGNSRATQINKQRNINSSIDNPYITQIQKERTQSVNQNHRDKTIDNQTMPLAKASKKIYKQEETIAHLVSFEKKHQIQQKTSSMLFLCGKCCKNILKIVIHDKIQETEQLHYNFQNSLSNELVHKKKTKHRKQKYDLEKYKISMCVKIASGKFKNMRISDQEHIRKRADKSQSSFDRSQIKSQIKEHRENNQIRKQKNQTQYLKQIEEQRNSHEKNEKQKSVGKQDKGMSGLNRKQKIKVDNILNQSQSFQTIFPDIFASKQEIKELTPEKQVTGNKKMKKEISELSKLKANLNVKKSQPKLENKLGTTLNMSNFSLHGIGEVGSIDLQNISKILDKQKVKAPNDKKKK